MYGRPRRLFIAAAALLVFLIVVGAIATIATTSGVRRSSSTRRPVLSAPSSVRSSARPTVQLQAVAPATTIPAQSPVQQRYDQGFVQGYSSPSSKAMIANAESLHLPAPAVAGGWPSLAVSNTPDGWAATFVRGLFTIDFARQSRAALGAWIVAQDAPDLMPGLPAEFRGQALYVSVMDPQAMAQPPVIPSRSQWRIDAKAGTRWAVSDLQVSLDPQWQAMVDAGWQPRDIRASIEDVSGLVSVTNGATTTRRHLSLSVAVGSAQWHQGYGTVAVTSQGN